MVLSSSGKRELGFLQKWKGLSSSNMEIGGEVVSEEAEGEDSF